MQLIQLLYCSQASKDIRSEDIDQILEVSRENNARRHITGLLCNDENYFLQLLEGSYRIVNDVYNTIANDQRHVKMTLLYYRSASSRLFPKWNMGHIETDQYINELIQKYLDENATLEIDDFGQACIEYMQTMKKTG